MVLMEKLQAYVLGSIVFVMTISCVGNKQREVLVFSKTEGFRHASIEDGKRALLAMGREHGFLVDTSEDATIFTDVGLGQYDCLVFLNTSMDILNESQQLAMQRYVQAGGGFVGIHSAADTEYDWPWYGRLVGAYFNGHPNNPNVRDAIVRRLDSTHISCAHLPQDWSRSDEWYNYKDIQQDLNVLLNLDESTYDGGTNGLSHPISWYHEFEGGRSFYTGGGHTRESFSEPLFLKHLWGGIQYAWGDGLPLDYTRAGVVPEPNRFVKDILEDYLDEPMELAVMPDGNLIYIQRKGEIKIFDLVGDSSRVVNRLGVHTEHEDGLLGMALDPAFEENGWIYFFYSPPGEDPKQHVSRFDFINGKVDLESEKVILEIVTQRDECCHSGGCLEFGPNGNLFISVGDNTNPFASDGYSPSDERPGRTPWDAQRSSGNTNDLRGKVLRIRPLEDGSYSIPDGNLFSDTSQGRPEIYTMGCRNPFRISIDSHSGYLYWGDVGPDAGNDSLGRGPRGHDEVNQARFAGFFGWPYFNGDNKPYHEYDFALQKSLDKYDAMRPVNNSPNNTGAEILPPAQPAFIWYPYAESPEFPLVGEGGRNAMAGPVFHREDYPDNERRYPGYYDGKLFTYDWIRGWMMAVTLSEEGDYMSMERFAPQYKFNNPIDIVMSPYGDMYILEYGTAWFRKNPDARLIHLRYQAGNRHPTARMSASKTVGAAPLTVDFVGNHSSDDDQDELTFEWDFGDGSGASTDADPSHTYTVPGKYGVIMTVKDKSGASGSTSIDILVGNEPPEVRWDISGNKSFYRSGTSIDYALHVMDMEDGTVGDGIDSEAVTVTVDYIPEGKDINVASIGHEEMAKSAKYLEGKNLMAKSDCSSCHFVDRASVGPTYRDIALRYIGDDSGKEYLIDKIINGGGGVWGVNAMAAHPQLDKEEVGKMVEYIMSLASKKSKSRMPLQGTYTFAEGDRREGSYLFMATYADRGGNGIDPMIGSDLVMLRSPKFWVSDFDTIAVASTIDLNDEQSVMAGGASKIVVAADGGFIGFKDIDVSGLAALELSLSSSSEFAGGGTIALRSGFQDGELIDEVQVVPLDGIKGSKVLFRLENVDGKRDLFFVFSTESAKPVAYLIHITAMFDTEF